VGRTTIEWKAADFYRTQSQKSSSGPELLVGGHCLDLAVTKDNKSFMQGCLIAIKEESSEST
jgi:hypothetical protein